MPDIKKLFSYPGLVIDVKENASGDIVSADVLMSVSIDGKEHSIQRTIHQIGFDVKPGMQVIVNGIEREEMKELSFSIPKTIDLDEEEIAIIRTL